MLSLLSWSTNSMPVATSHGFGAYEEQQRMKHGRGAHKLDQTRRADRIQSTVAHMGMLQLEMDTIKVILKDPITTKRVGLLITVRAMEARPYQV
jgi:hypothetical protein